LFIQSFIQHKQNSLQLVLSVASPKSIYTCSSYCFFQRNTIYYRLDTNFEKNSNKTET